MRHARLLCALTAGIAAALAALPAYSQQLSFTPFHENGIYDLGERAGWRVTAARGTGTYDYVIKKNNLEVLKTGALDLSSGSATIETTLDEPAMLYVEVRTAPPVHLGAAIAPWKLKPAVPKPADFDSFWDAKLKALRRVPMNPVLTPEATGKAGVEFYTVRLDSLGSHVQGYLAKPAKGGKFPALVILQWAGVYALLPELATDRAAQGWLALDVDSHDMPPNQATGVPADYQTIGNTSRDTSYFLNMYLRDTRAVDYIASRPDWDGKTIVLLGTSMGGQQSLATAGLNPKVTAVLVNEPSGADTNGNLHGRQAGYPFWPSDNPAAMKTALYFDTVNFAPRIKAPVLAAIGFIDTTCPPAGIWTAINQIPGAKEVIPMIESDHNNRTPDKQGAWTSRSEEVLNTILHGGEFKPNQDLTRK
jgi:cephalosporin-C deacetylase